MQERQLIGFCRIGDDGIEILDHAGDGGTPLEQIVFGAPDIAVLYSLKIRQQAAGLQQFFDGIHAFYDSAVIDEDIRIFRPAFVNPSSR